MRCGIIVSCQVRVGVLEGGVGGAGEGGGDVSMQGQHLASEWLLKAVSV